MPTCPALTAADVQPSAPPSPVLIQIPVEYHVGFS
eukprot:CAMPEP_0113291878 /NCGR_PEP_ID=MMETSP0008_2-20120614/34309_1 /TAXON_ID=97485 /ORGANISM="Prymnesium parvum" /LENGTH=34 /DNA_ID=CAMNT_0000143871 /DNA_START=131 /DNA_END=232 /DNA_ORIENTATION=- /assembly_acc=CAM_ASM_000153